MNESGNQDGLGDMIKGKKIQLSKKKKILYFIESIGISNVKLGSLEFRPNTIQFKGML